MRDAAIVVEHHLLDVFRDHRSLGVRAGESADRVERAPARDDKELDATLERTPQDACIDEAIDARELRQGVAPQVLDVLIGSVGARNTPPLSGDQGGSS